MATVLHTATGERPLSDRPRNRSRAGRSSPRKLLGALRGPSCRQHLRRMTGSIRGFGLNGLRRSQCATPDPSSAGPSAAQPAVARIWRVLSGTTTVSVTTAADCPRIVGALHRGSYRGQRKAHRLWGTQLTGSESRSHGGRRRPFGGLKQAPATHRGDDAQQASSGATPPSRLSSSHEPSLALTEGEDDRTHFSGPPRRWGVPEWSATTRVSRGC